MGSMICAMVLVLAAPLGCATESSRAPKGPLVIHQSAARHLNHLSLRGAYADQVECSVEVWYPPRVISVEIGGIDGPEEHVQYEPCYELAGGDIPRGVMAYRCSADRIHEVPGSSGGGGDVQYIFGKAGDVIYKFSWPRAASKMGHVVDRFGISTDEVLHVTTVVRAEVQQRVNGAWMRLTRYRHGAGTGLWLAPADTIELRASFATFDARYFLDRVVISDSETSVTTGHSFAINRPQDGYWPYSPAQDFFRDFQSSVVKAGEEFRWSYPTRGEPIVQMYTLDVFVVRDVTPDPLRWVLSFVGPSMAQPSDPAELSDWPLSLADLRAGKRVSDLGYPGGVLVPRWAVDKLLELGPGFLASNAENLAAYEELLQTSPGRPREGARSSAGTRGR